MMAAVDASWLAAMIDGEGSIVIYRKRRKIHDIFYAHLEVSNTWKPIVDKCLRITGVGAIFSDCGTNFPRHKWGVTNREAVQVLAEVYQYLIQKKEQAKVAFALQATNKNRGRNGASDKLGPKPITEEEYQEKVRLWELCKDLNQRRIASSGLPEPNPQLIPNRKQTDLWVKDPRYADVNRAMCDILTTLKGELYAKLRTQARVNDVAKAKALLAKHGLTIQA